MLKIVVYVNKSLKMSDGKMAGQACHAVSGLMSGKVYDRENTKIVVLGLRQAPFARKFEEIEAEKYMQIDMGITEVTPKSKTAFAFIEEE